MMEDMKELERSFYSKLVRLKGALCGCVFTDMHVRFYSKLVRLKDHRDASGAWYNMFLFQIGAIKRINHAIK